MKTTNENKNLINNITELLNETTDAELLRIIYLILLKS